MEDVVRTGFTGHGKAKLSTSTSMMTSFVVLGRLLFMIQQVQSTSIRSLYHVLQITAGLYTLYSRDYGMMDGEQLLAKIYPCTTPPPRCLFALYPSLLIYS